MKKFGLFLYIEKTIEIEEAVDSQNGTIKLVSARNVVSKIAVVYKKKCKVMMKSEE